MDTGHCASRDGNRIDGGYRGPFVVRWSRWRGNDSRTGKMTQYELQFILVSARLPGNLLFSGKSLPTELFATELHFTWIVYFTPVVSR